MGQDGAVCVWRHIMSGNIVAGTRLGWNFNKFNVKSRRGEVEEVAGSSPVRPLESNPP